MNESESLLKLVQEHLDEFCSTQRQDFSAISDALPTATFEADSDWAEPTDEFSGTLRSAFCDRHQLVNAQCRCLCFY